MKKLSDWLRKRSVLIVITLAALLLQMISAIQYRYVRGLLEEELEKTAFRDLMASALRIQEVTSKAEVGACSQLWHIERHLQDPDYMTLLLKNLVKGESDNIIGAGIGFKPGFYPSKGWFYEPYARQYKDSIAVTQIASEKHDYTQKDLYQAAMKGDTLKWTAPYLDAEGAKDVVISYGLPIRDEHGEPVGLLAVDLSTDWVGEVVNMHHINPSSFSLVMSEDGELVAAPADSVASLSLVKKIVAMVNDSTVEREMKANGRVTGFAFYDEERQEPGHVYYAIKKNQPRWQMVMVCYDKEVYGKLDDMLKYIMWMALAGLVVLGIIIQLFVRSHRRLQTTQMEQERIGSELRIAKDIQQQMLPHVNEHGELQNEHMNIARNDLRVYGSLVPAREVGGDLFDFFLRDEKLFFCIGDVSGKGVPSAMLMAVTHSLFRSASMHENNPARMMQVINQTSCHGNEANMFVTLFIGVLDLPTGRLRYCNAGHDMPMILASDGTTISSLDAKPNLPVGVFDHVKYEMRESMLTPRSMLFLYTDGLTEARDPQRHFFGLERAKTVLRNAAHDGQPQQLLQAMTDAVNQFVEDAEPSDDLTMMAIWYAPQQEQDVLSETLTLKNDVHQIETLSDFVKDITRRLNMEKKQARNVQLAVEEAVVNVMNYAYPIESEGTITIDAKSDGQWLKFIISDEGVAFDPTATLQVDTTLKVEDRPIGGLGIHLVRKLMDSVNYERVDGKNVLTLRKRIEGNEKDLK